MSAMCGRPSSLVPLIQRAGAAAAVLFQPPRIGLESAGPPGPIIIARLVGNGPQTPECVTTSIGFDGIVLRFCRKNGKALRPRLRNRARGGVWISLIFFSSSGLDSKNASSTAFLYHRIDLTRVRSGPTAVRSLADWGAKLKIEMPPASTSEGPGPARRQRLPERAKRNNRGSAQSENRPTGAT